MTEQVRIAPKQIKRKMLDSHTVQSVYKAGYTTFSVKSIFSDKNQFPDILYRIVLDKLVQA